MGIKEPFTILQTSDTHMTLVDENDSEARHNWAEERGRGLAPNANKNLDFLREYIKETGYLLFHTGDMMDFITPANLRAAQQFAEDTNMIMVTIQQGR